MPRRPVRVVMHLREADALGRACRRPPGNPIPHQSISARRSRSDARPVVRTSRAFAHEHRCRPGGCTGGHRASGARSRHDHARPRGAGPRDGRGHHPGRRRGADQRRGPREAGRHGRELPRRDVLARHAQPGLHGQGRRHRQARRRRHSRLRVGLEPAAGEAAGRDAERRPHRDVGRVQVAAGSPAHRSRTSTRRGRATCSAPASCWACCRSVPETSCATTSTSTAPASTS